MQRKIYGGAKRSCVALKWLKLGIYFLQFPIFSCTPTKFSK